MPDAARIMISVYISIWIQLYWREEGQECRDDRYIDVNFHPVLLLLSAKSKEEANH